MRGLHVETDLDKSPDPVHVVWDAVGGGLVHVTSGRGRSALLVRHLEMLSHGPMHSHARPGGCTGTVGFLQVHGTCWFNSILHAFFMSDLGSKLMRALYPDWVLGVRAGGDERRSHILQHFRFMLDLATAHPGRLLDAPVKPAPIVARLHKYSPQGFPDVGRNNGYVPHRYARKLLVFLGVPQERVVFLPETRMRIEWMSMDDRVAPVLRLRKSVPLVVMAYTRQSAGCGPEHCSPNRFSFEDAGGARHEYVLDAAVLSSIHRPGASGGHAVAGITCGGRRFLLDSNLPRDAWRAGAGAYDPRFHAQGARVRAYDWRSSTKEVRTVTAPRDLTFSGAGSSKLCIYYHRGILDRVYAAGRLSAETWLGYMAEHGPEARPPSAVRAGLRDAMKRAFKLDGR